jgi:putative oxidoreductase
MRALSVLGRLMFGGYFVYHGINHFLNSRTMSHHAASKGVGAPGMAVPASGAMLVGGGLSVMTGAHPQRGLAAIIAFLIPVTAQMHRFWEIEDPLERQPELVNFTKNVALLGAALALMELPEPWPLGLDEADAPQEDMYVHLGGREMRALPA